MTTNPLTRAEAQAALKAVELLPSSDIAELMHVTLPAALATCEQAMALLEAVQDGGDYGTHDAIRTFVANWNKED